MADDDQNSLLDDAQEESTLELVDARTQKKSLDEANKILSLDGTIKRHLAGIKGHKEEQKKLKEMLESIFDSDEVYQERNKAAKEANKAKSEIKKMIMSQPQARDLDEKIKAAKAQIDELNDGLSFYLLEYQQSTGANEFEDEDGKVQKIVYVAKLVRG